MARDILKAKLDIIFKKLFSDKNNEDLLIDLIASLLDIPVNSIEQIEIKNTEILPEDISQKAGRMDLKLKVDGRLVNIEMQINSHSGFKDRVLYYWSKLYCEGLGSGEKYIDLKQTVSISILNFNLFDCPEFHSVFKVKEDDRGELLTDKFAIHFFELKKINKKVNQNDRMELWLQLINAETEEELTMLNETNVPEIKKAVRVIREMSDDDRIRELVRQREKDLHDRATELWDAKREGRAEGRAEGKAEGKAEGRAEGQAKERDILIKKLRKSGMTEERINEILSLNVD